MIETTLVTDIGCCRHNNEDCIRHIRPADDKTMLQKGALTILADGMGGHQSGDVASQLAVDIIGQMYFEYDTECSIKTLQTCFARANQAIYQAAMREPHLHGMGTTCTALLIKNNQACFAHIGDSRLYLLRDGRLVLLTTDDTVVMNMMANGLLTKAEARNHPDRHIITRALGTSPNAAISASNESFPIQAGDVFLLCSDGVHDLVNNDEIKQILSWLSPHAAANYLVALAKEKGGYDNISVAIVAVREFLATV